MPSRTSRMEGLKILPSVTPTKPADGALSSAINLNDPPPTQCPPAPDLPTSELNVLADAALDEMTRLDQAWGRR
jgi:hypothetical protein